jgi:hypothetical protein
MKRFKLQMFLVIMQIYSIVLVKVNSADKSGLTTNNCGPLCQECKIIDINHCTICRPGVILFQSSCNCPDGMYKDNLSTCQSCHVECPVCWGPESDMCGSSQDVTVRLVNLQDEIIEYLSKTDFNPKDIDVWVAQLKAINTEVRSILPIPIDQVYKNNTLFLDLPIGSFSKYDGTFIPIPAAFIDKTSKLTDSHWLFKKGTWDGTQWTSYYPRLPSFIKFKGDRNKIYFENNGYWVYDTYKTWYYIPSNKIHYPVSTVTDDLMKLNKIKFNIGKYTYNKLKGIMSRKKSEIQSNLILT